MAARHSPTVLRRRLGAELRGLRRRTGLTCAQVAERLRARDTGTNWSETKVSRVETGRISVHPGDIAELLEFYEVTGGERHDDIMDLARLARQRGWWHEHGAALPDWFTIFVDLETEAVVVRTFQPEVVPGLLQTEAYARAVLTSDPAGPTNDEIHRRVALRLARQELLTKPDPALCSAVIGEAVLHRRVGGPCVLRGQLDHLLAMAERPNVHIRVVPLSAGVHIGLGGGAFVVLEFADPDDPRVVYVDHLGGARYLEREADVEPYLRAFEDLEAIALHERGSIGLIATLGDRLRDDDPHPQHRH